MRSAFSAPLLALMLGAFHGAPALAQSAAGPQDLEKVKQVFVYGEDPCPPSQGDEIVVCARLPDNDRYRIPQELRSDPNAPVNQAWANRARVLETVGAAGINSCSPVGAGGMTGCFNQLASRAKEERKTTLGAASWSDAVAAERQKRLGNLDAESEEVEARVKAEEAEEARRPAQTTPAP